MVAEILSRDDSMVDVEEKTAEDAAWGVRNVWLVNPWDGVNSPQYQGSNYPSSAGLAPSMT